MHTDRPATVLAEGEPIFRFEVPVDDDWHALLAGTPLHVASRRSRVVEFWATPSPALREFRIVGTGHPAPGDVTYWGTAVTEYLVWHLVERTAPAVNHG
jgi:hypothetical protein